jgi:hypothetical protein
MTVTAEEFLRRFLLHVLPHGFVRIRFFGFLANRRRKSLLPLCQQLFLCRDSQDIALNLTPTEKAGATACTLQPDHVWNSRMSPSSTTCARCTI